MVRLWVAVVGLLAGPVLTNAAIIVMRPCNASPFTCVSAIRGLNVNGTILDVTTSFAEVTSITGADFFFGNRAAAQDAATSIFVALDASPA